MGLCLPHSDSLGRLGRPRGSLLRGGWAAKAWKGGRPDWPEATFQMSSHTYFPPWPRAAAGCLPGQPSPARPSPLCPPLSLSRPGARGSTTGWIGHPRPGPSPHPKGAAFPASRLRPGLRRVPYSSNGPSWLRGGGDQFPAPRDPHLGREGQ